MAVLEKTCTLWTMRSTIRFTASKAPQTRLGRLTLAGHVDNAVPVMPRKLRQLDEYVISVVTAGRGSYTDASARHHPITARSITVVRPRDPHWYGTHSGERWTEWFAVIHSPLIDALCEAAVITTSGPRPLPDGCSVASLARLLELQPRTTTAAEHQLTGLAQWLVTALPADEPHDVWQRAADLLTEDFTRTLDLSGLALDLGLGYDEFRKGFTAHMGDAPLRYRNLRRLEAAADLLNITSLRMRDIADRLGYVDEFHFSRRFKERYEISPKDYRRHHHQ